MNNQYIARITIGKGARSTIGYSQRRFKTAANAKAYGLRLLDRLAKLKIAEVKL